MDSYDTTDRLNSAQGFQAADSARGDTLAAIFADRDSAHEALTELHHAGYRDVWVGVTHADTAGAEPTVESDGGGFMESISRFFSGEESTGHSLHDALIKHGVSQDLVRQTESSIAPGNAVVTVDGENDPEEAVSILQQFGGRLVGGASSYGSPSLRTSGTSTSGSGETGIGATGIGAAGLGAASMRTPDIDRVDDRAVVGRDKMDETRRLQLREERLSVDKERVSAGEARIGKEVVSEKQSIDVPVFREELYVERRPVSAGTAASSTTPIGEGEEIVVPLTREQVDVQKRTVVTEEVAVGKRRVEDTEHVSDTVRREELRVDDKKTTNPTGTTGTSGVTGASTYNDATLDDTTASKRNF
ncbi:MAG: YsnF/AvaK domain-containing protein [Candidatus Eremiobacteraeota bacterium]|nr:YsnF/AvaK domain-containing protein [Candidatus Eremiobacteraeota bacterium]